MVMETDEREREAPEGMWDDPGYGEDPPQFPEGDRIEELREQEFVERAPDWAVIPPGGAMFANATWLVADSHLRASLVDTLLGWPEMSQVTTLTYELCWRRNKAPLRKGRWGDMPIYASVEVVPARAVWQAKRDGIENFPRLWIDLHWQHFENLRNPKSAEETAGYVHRLLVQRDIHRALAALEVSNDIITRVPPDVSEFNSTVERFGIVTPGLYKMREQLTLWGDRGDPVETDMEGPF